MDLRNQSSFDIRLIEAAPAWDALVDACQGHPLQTWEWGELKHQTGPWTAYHLEFSQGGEVVGGAQVLVRKMPPPLGSTAYVPRGPFATDPALLPALADAAARWCKEQVKPVSLKIDPAVTELALPTGWRESERVLVAKTAVMDLTPELDDIMKSIPNRKCRQYIRKAGRDGVTCRPGEQRDLPEILRLYHATAEADGFAIHEDEFYEQAFTLLGDVSQLFVSEYEGRMQSFLWNVTTSGTAFELWGAVNDEGKRTRANYLLKWVAIQAAKERGAQLYDLNGLLNDGISDFKMLFVKEPTVWVGSYDKPLSPLYGLMNKAIELRRKNADRKATQHDTAETRA